MKGSEIIMIKRVVAAVALLAMLVLTGCAKTMDGTYEFLDEKGRKAEGMTAVIKGSDMRVSYDDGDAVDLVIDKDKKTISGDGQTNNYVVKDNGNIAVIGEDNNITMVKVK
jgi:hypothetical protein